ncbi:hypothetical protein [Planctellipticum variicoloris]|uniref:hypothetical protein n=1 Tax=Planctellipticum variicoloris TaxID=3064265 RepID=UPI00301355B5|nr:hypothetical protein SH412_003185 [Planctomycetaceae bacterium SH412]
MPLRDHFRSPVDNVHAWDELHGGWPAMIVRQLDEMLPEPWFAAPGVHLGTLQEVADATTSPLRPTLTLEPQLPGQDVYEVRISDSRRNRRLVAAIEIVSPSNKDRPETRGMFVSKVAAILKHDICVSIVDVATTSPFNLYAELMNFLGGTDPALGDQPPPISAATLRTRYEGPRRLLDHWYYPLAVGENLPTLPVWLKADWAISLDLEASYEEACRTLRIR